MENRRCIFTMRINTNISSANTQHNLRKVEAQLAQTMERLSSGKRINGAADDAAGLAISTRMEAASRGKEVAYRNTLDGVSALQTADSALGTATNILQRMRELAVQAKNGTNSAAERTNLDTEFQSLNAELGAMQKGTTFNGEELLDGGFDIKLQVGSATSETRDITITTDLADLASKADNVLTIAEAGTAITNIDTALDAISTDRASIGADLNRLSFVQDDLDTSKNNLDSANSRIMDADMADEVSKMARQNIINSSAISMLSKANSAPQGFLQLLQG